jgi:hypothetical protein
MDLGLKLRTMIIYIYIYNIEALEKKLRTLTKGGRGGGVLMGSDRGDHFFPNFFWSTFWLRCRRRPM